MRQLSTNATPTIVIHGGAGIILKAKMTPEREQSIRHTLTESLQAGFEILTAGGRALDAVCCAVNVMEDSPLFNAGKGAVYTHDGKHEQDATIMDGATGMAGGVACVKHIANPIDLARLVMEQSSHVLMDGNGAEQFAVRHGVNLIDDEYFHTEFRMEQLQRALVRASEKTSGNTTSSAGLSLSEDDKHGTVGAVALDSAGHLAATTSSGGMTNKRFGRIGDSAQIGAGTYADDICAVSCTGHGEFFMRGVVAYDVAALMRYRQMSLEDAAAMVVQTKLTDRQGTGGLIAIDKDGNIAMPFNTTGMYRGHSVANAEGDAGWVGIFDE